MLYQAIKPIEPLQPFVEKYYVLEHEGVVQSDLTFPANGYSALIFSYGDRPAQSSPGGRLDVLPGSFLTGPATGPSTLRFGRRVGIAAACFKSAGFVRFFGTSAQDVLNLRVDFRLVAGSDSRRLEEQLQHAAGHRARIDLIEAYLLRRLRLHEKDGPDWLDYTADAILQARGNVSIDSIGARFNVSGRQLRRRFKERTGLGPKLYARLKRFGYANVLLSKYPRLDVQDVIFMAGLYDQSHLIKEFRAFSDGVPSSLREEPHRAGMGERATVFYNTRAVSSR